MMVSNFFKNSKTRGLDLKTYKSRKGKINVSYKNIWVGKNLLVSQYTSLHNRGVFRTFELRVLTVIDCPKIAGAKGLTVTDFPILRVLKHP